MATNFLVVAINVLKFFSLRPIIIFLKERFYAEAIVSNFFVIHSP